MIFTILFSIYGETKQTDKYLESSFKLFDIDQGPDTGTNLAIAAMVNGDDDLLINEIKKYEIISPNLKVFRLQPLLFKNDLKNAEPLLADIKSLYPSYKNKASVYDSAVVYLKKNGYDMSKFKDFEGTYRANFNEQVHTLWIEHNRLIKYVKNQSMFAYLPGGKNTVVSGFMNNETYRCELILSDSGKPIGYHFSELYFKNTNTYWFWKEDEAIQKANEAYDKGDFENALALYKLAIEANPKHLYLKNIVATMEYTASKGKDSIQSQNETFAGDYGPRKFWVEDGKFYYKRKDDQTELAKVELLPISENRYMDLTRLGTMMAFEENDSGKMASKSYSFVVDKDLAFEWRDSDNNENVTNYFVKDED